MDSETGRGVERLLELSRPLDRPSSGVTDSTIRLGLELNTVFLNLPPTLQKTLSDYAYRLLAQAHSHGAVSERNIDR